MTVSPSFPPVDALLANLRKVDYVKHLNSFMDFVESACLIIAAICIILARKWRQHKVTEKLQISAAFVIVALMIIFDYLKETAWPIMKQTTQTVWKICYTVARPPLTV